MARKLVNNFIRGSLGYGVDTRMVSNQALYYSIICDLLLSRSSYKPIILGRHHAVTHIQHITRHPHACVSSCTISFTKLNNFNVIYVFYLIYAWFEF